MPYVGVLVARPGLTKHRKFLRLAKAIGSEPLARGLLEFIWESAYENGDDFLGDSTDVENLAHWGGEPGVITAALLDSGFIDLLSEGDAGCSSPSSPQCYRVHDLLDHAPSYVHGRREKEEERRRGRSCNHCSKPFRSTEHHALYCSHGCRSAAFKARQKAEKVTQGDARMTEPSAEMTQDDGPHAHAHAHSLGSTTPPTPPAKAEGTRKSRRGKADDLLEAGEVSPDSVKFGRMLVAGWRKADPDGRLIDSRPTDVVTRMDAIAKRQPLFSPEVQYLAGMAYCSETRQRFKAAQYFLSLEVDPQTQKPPFHPFCVAVIQGRKQPTSTPVAADPTSEVTRV